MKVILLQDIPKIGKKFDVKEVADGYARNFLLPEGLIKPATEEALKILEAEKAAAAKKAEEELKEAEKTVSQLDGQEIELFAKADESGKLFGAITPLKIAKVLKEKGFEAKKSQVKIPEPIKTIGEHEITLEMEHGLEAKIKLIVSEQLKEDQKEEDLE